MGSNGVRQLDMFPETETTTTTTITTTTITTTTTTTTTATTTATATTTITTTTTATATTTATTTITTTATTTITATTTATTTTTIATTTTITTTITTTTTTTTTTTKTTTTQLDIPCVPSNTYVLSYDVTPTTYQKQTYTYTGTSTGLKILEFGFKAVSTTKTWHLDDVSIINKNASNSEMIVNGGFENGNLIGWQVLCSSTNCGTKGGNITQSDCHTGSFCYEGTCQNDYDFLRQTFTVINGHVYVLTFWLYTDGHHSQLAYVNIG
ncbi:unnamed protein product [Rotaria sordida]|uniref:Uncharacterized protein n=1 Tax=Rotaria sordida TaxID=392033 RepID=A0A815D5Q8_9BILA|nr:unnamed protein product [Rotaria sordida]